MWKGTAIAGDSLLSCTGPPGVERLAGAAGIVVCLVCLLALMGAALSLSKALVPQPTVAFTVKEACEGTEILWVAG